MLELYVALMHYPVVNKNGDIIASAVTNLDLHDIARAAKTYGVKAFYVVTPLKDQQELVMKLLSHWTTGAGTNCNKVRGEALELAKISENLDEVITEITKQTGRAPKTVVTSAKKNMRNISFNSLRQNLKEGNPYLLLFGTAWGFSEQFISDADYVLSPIMADSDYNHLSVRSAVSVVLDRLKGDYRGSYAND
ncbi:MAG: RNA methyltransferase [Deltaproteobacteria bacterium]|nr:RNA methyltransferase [Deltaproteobacteria bacterium]MBW2218696.1 RNA methyltransferase [Deltaproteobacteria bacterium]